MYYPGLTPDVTPPTPAPAARHVAWCSTSAPYLHIYDVVAWERLPDPAVPPAGAATDLAFSPDGSILVVAHANSPYLTIYETATWTKLPDPAVLPPSNALRLAFSHDGSQLAVTHASSPFITRYNVATWTTLPALPGATSVSCVVYSLDGQYLYGGLTATSLYSRWSMNTLEISALGSGSLPCSDLAVNKAGWVYRAAANTTGRYFLLDTFAPTVGNSFPLPAQGVAAGTRANGIAVSPDGQSILLGQTGGTPAVYILAPDGALKFGIGGLILVEGVAFSPDGALFAVGRAGPPYIAVGNTLTGVVRDAPALVPASAVTRVSFGV